MSENKPMNKDEIFKILSQETFSVFRETMPMRGGTEIGEVLVDFIFEPGDRAFCNIDVLRLPAGKQGVLSLSRIVSARIHCRRMIAVDHGDGRFELVLGLE